MIDRLEVFKGKKVIKATARFIIFHARVSRFISRHVGAHEIQTLRQKVFFGEHQSGGSGEFHISALNGDKAILFKFM